MRKTSSMSVAAIGVLARLLKLRRPALQITCVDRSAVALSHVVADEKVHCEVTKLPFDDRSFDCVSCLEVIEHLTVEDYKKALTELTRIAKNTVIVGVPYNEAIEENVDTCPQCQRISIVICIFALSTMPALLTCFRISAFSSRKPRYPWSIRHYLGFRTYYKLQRRLQGVPDQSAQFMSPICPLCGYTPSQQVPISAESNRQPVLRRSARVRACRFLETLVAKADDARLLDLQRFTRDGATA